MTNRSLFRFAGGLFYFGIITGSVRAAATVVDFGIGLNYASLYYFESISGGASTETASYPSTMADLGIHFSDSWVLRLEYQNAANVISLYKGNSLSTGAAVTSSDMLSFTTEEAKLYYEFVKGLSVFVGYGMRDWYRGLGAYNEEYVSSYAPAGLYMVFDNTNGREISAEASVNTTLGANMTVTSGTTTVAKTQFTLGNYTGYRIQFNWNEPLGAGFSIKFFPWFQQLEYGQSSSQVVAGLGTVYEPHSVTSIYGLGALLKYSF